MPSTKRDLFKQRLCLDILTTAAVEGYRLGLQSIGEFYAATTRRRILTRLAPQARGRRVRQRLQGFPAFFRRYTLAAQDAARGRFLYWDAVLLYSASDAGCDVILSETWPTARGLGAITVRNPFGPRVSMKRRAHTWSDVTLFPACGAAARRARVDLADAARSSLSDSSIVDLLALQSLDALGNFLRVWVSCAISAVVDAVEIEDPRISASEKPTRRPRRMRMTRARSRVE